MNQVQRQTMEGMIEALDIAGKIMSGHTKRIRSLEARIHHMETEFFLQQNK